MRRHRFTAKYLNQSSLWTLLVYDEAAGKFFKLGSKRMVNREAEALNTSYRKSGSNNIWWYSENSISEIKDSGPRNIIKELVN